MGAWDWPWDPPGQSDRQTISLLREINRKVDLLMTAQDDINTDVAAIQSDENTISTAVTAIQAFIADLQGTGIDTSQLDAVVASLGTVTQSVAAIPPAAPPAPATPPAEPTA